MALHCELKIPPLSYYSSFQGLYSQCLLNKPYVTRLRLMPEKPVICCKVCLRYTQNKNTPLTVTPISHTVGN